MEVERLVPCPSQSQRLGKAVRRQLFSQAFQPYERAFILICPPSEDVAKIQDGGRKVSQPSHVHGHKHTYIHTNFINPSLMRLFRVK